MDKALSHQDVLDQLKSNMIIGVGGWAPEESQCP